MSSGGHCRSDSELGVFVGTCFTPKIGSSGILSRDDRSMLVGPWFHFKYRDFICLVITNKPNFKKNPIRLNLTRVSL
ncbi:hypothetical protein AMELA_G00044120 [Ameiurus melas]|uniref:Uncharacterized protein n=1 Tax=Ameiurus melas TaxID=219545 RepID=A0A7J6B874_AMEME|nr:hypothetical protein AMELA_G00044120 [Ameiurus melas]